jgi:hypothetical protein
MKEDVMSRRPVGGALVLALTIALLAAPVAWSAPERDAQGGGWGLGWLEQLGGWLAGVITATGSLEDRGPGIDPDGAATGSSSEGGDDGSGGDRGPGIDPNG